MIKNIAILALLALAVFSRIELSEKDIKISVLNEQNSIMKMENEAFRETQRKQAENAFLKEIEIQIAKEKLKEKISYSNYKKELKCLALNLYHEARGESEAGQKAVAEVVLNRVASKHYPNTICEVVYQRKQFSWANSKKLRNKVIGENNKLYKTAKKISIDVMIKNAPTLDATHYHTHAVNPSWNRNMKQVAMIGEHRFFTN